MPIRFELEAYGDKLVSRELTRFAHRGEDASPAFETIADQFMRAEKRRFSTSGNGTWEALRASTVARKASSANPVIRANAGRILVATGRLRRSLTVRHDPDQELVVAHNFMIFGTRVGYAQYHQKGEGVPVRKPLGFTEAAKRDALRTLQRFVVTGDPGGSLASTRSRAA